MNLRKWLATDKAPTTLLIRLLVGSVFLSEGIQKFLFAEAQGAMFAALATGGTFQAAATKAYAPYRRAVRANRRRLGA